MTAHQPISPVTLHHSHPAVKQSERATNVVSATVTCYTQAVPEATIPVIFTTAFVVGLSGALMPDPLLAVTISQTAQRGFWAGPLLIVGHGILELALVIALIFGLSQFITGELVSSIIGIVGGLVLIFIGITTINRGWRRSSAPSASTAGVASGKTLMLSGVVVSLSNPYWFIWWATVGLAYLLWSLELGAAGVTSFFTGHFLADLGWYSLVSFIVVSGRKVVSDRAYDWLLMFCGAALIALGLYFIVSGIQFLAA